MSQSRLPRAAVPSLIAALAVLAGLLIEPSAHIAEADTDAMSTASMPSVNFSGYVAPNIIVGNTSELCPAASARVRTSPRQDRARTAAGLPSFPCETQQLTRTAADIEHAPC